MTGFDEARLDDEQSIERFDRASTLRSLAGAGAQVRVGARVSEEAGIGRLAGLEPRGVVVAAAGGSAAVADLFDALTRGGSAVPVQACAAGPLPGWVGALDLVIAVSQSGRASGALALAVEAGRRGASLLTVGAADSPLAAVCAQARGIHVPIHVQGASSRTSMWAQATPALMAAEVLGLASVPAATIEALADVLDECARQAGPSAESFTNPAKLLATEIAESAPIVLGSGPFGAVAARRSAEMLGRTGRVPVASGVLPDAASQIVACFDGPLAAGDGGNVRADDVFADPYLDGPARAPLRLIMLRDTSDDVAATSDEARAGRLLTDTVVSAAADAGVRVSFVDAPQADPLLRLAAHVALTDFAATYLAIGHGFDPSTSPHVTLLRGTRGSLR